MKENPGGGRGGWEMASGLSSAAGILCLPGMGL